MVQDHFDVLHGQVCDDRLVYNESSLFDVGVLVGVVALAHEHERLALHQRPRYGYGSMSAHLDG
eukprot:scaffold54651_cov40-Tisochrysis_lutea.AAC.1